MRGHFAAALIAAAPCACACGTRKTTTSGGDAGPATAEPARLPLLGLDGGSPDEDAVRSGRRTGMAGDLPEVATEPLIEALLAGRTPWRRFVDPHAGVVELRRTPGDDEDAAAVDVLVRRCGAAIDTTLAEHAALMLASLGRTELGYELSCANLALALPDPDGAAPHALCSVDSPAAYAVGHDLVFVPDAALGLRLVGVSAVDGAPGADERIDRFGAELARTGPLCP